MKQQYPLCRKPVIVQQINGVVAIPPASEAKAVPATPPDFTADLRALPPVAARALAAFCRAGGTFHPADAPIDGAPHHLYLHSNGQLTIDSGLVSIRFWDEVADADVRACLAR